MRVDPIMHRLREHITVHGQRRARLHPGPIGRPKDNRTEHTELGLQQAVRVGQLRALECVGTDEFREAAGRVRGSAAHGAHLVEHNIDLSFSELPRGFGTREAATHYVNRVMPVQCRTKAGVAAMSACSSATSHSSPHLRHLRYDPRVLFDFASTPTLPQSGQVSASGLSQHTKSHLG